MVCASSHLTISRDTIPRPIMPKGCRESVREVTERMWVPVNPWAGPRPLAPSSVPGMWVPLAFAVQEAGPRAWPWDNDVVLTPFAQYMWWNPVNILLWAFKLLVGRCKDLLTLVLPKTNLINKLVPLLKLLPNNLRGLPPSLVFPWLCRYRGQFVNQQRGFHPLCCYM